MNGSSVTDSDTDVPPRPEHPRPQFVREHWLNLNGVWEFEFDHADSGLENGILLRTLKSRIVVPFAPESELSGIGDPEFHEAVWYRRAITVPNDWPRQQVLLHFQAVDHDTTVWVNGTEVGRHRGGFTPFSFDITDALDPDRSAWVVVRARDHRHAVQARGKQATWTENSHAFYTRTTGIWQTVWLESVPTKYLQRPRFVIDAQQGCVATHVPLSQPHVVGAVRVSIADRSGSVASGEVPLGRGLEPSVLLTVPSHRRRLWEPSDPFLYDAVIELLDADGAVVDRLDSYFGMRSLAIDGTRLLLNGRPIFQRLVLDQGYWPESLMTAPSDAALERDIRLALQAGFNGARVHEKVAEERYLYHADRLGYMLWGEFADWGASGQGPEGDNQRPTASFVAQWIEVLRRDGSHPSIIGWCPLNETYQLLHDRMTVLDDVTAAMYWATKSIDPSRPVVDASGYSHRVPDADIWDSHDYEQDPEIFARNHAGLTDGRPYTNTMPDGRPYSRPYAGQPFMLSEFGGIWWVPELADEATGDGHDTSWGYGSRVRDCEAFYQRFGQLVRVIDSNPLIFGYCYTQLTDVFQEQNGIYRFDRTTKLDVTRVRDAQSAIPAYEAAAKSSL